MVFYFTASGNSLYVAKQFSDAPISIPQELKKDKLSYEAETIGIVCPVYTGELPQIVRRFIEKASFKTDYFYMILTYGHDYTVSAEWAAKFCAQNGILVAYAQPILMVDNFLPGFDMEAELKIDKQIPQQLEQLKADVAARVTGVKAPTPEGKALYDMVAGGRKNMPPMSPSMMLDIKTDVCNGCGVCTKVCPLGSLKIEGGKATRASDACEGCFACVHNCPQKAVGMRFPERNPNARYRYPEISPAEIVTANCQI